MSAPELYAGLTEVVAAFEQGSGLTVSAIGIAMSAIGGLTVMALCAWAIGQQLPAFGTGKISPGVFWFRALVGTIILVVCGSIFAVSSPVSP